MKEFLKLDKTLILGDTHIHDRSATIQRRQIDCIKRIVLEEGPEEVIQLGDFFDKRSPSPEALLAGKEVTDFLSKNVKRTVILRGNHDSSNKSDNGVTALSLFEYKNIKIVHSTEVFDNAVFIPHYEDEDYIKQQLSLVHKDSWVFSHIGYADCFNSLGDLDFSIPFDSFRNPTVLGHIHKYVNQETANKNGFVTIMGTPYTTSYTEWGKSNYYGILSNGSLKAKAINHGLRYCVFNYADLPEAKAMLSDRNYGTRLRVYVDRLSELDTDGLIKSIISEYEVDYVDIKYKPIFDEDNFSGVSTFSPDKSLVKITESIIEQYVDSAIVSIGKDDLMDGFRLLKDEHKKNNNQ